MASIKERQKIYDLYRNGLTMSQIAKELPYFTRSSISGYIGRAIQNGILQRRSYENKHDNKKKSVKVSNFAALNAVRRIEARLDAKINNSEPIVIEQSTGKLKILELNKNSCRYICSNDLYCGEEIFDSGNKFPAYCRYHHSKCFNRCKNV